jgi:hypothetical protein
MVNAFNHARGAAAKLRANCGAAINQKALISWCRARFPTSVAPQ